MTDQELNAKFESLEASIKAEGLITRRHFELVADGLRADVRLIAEDHEVLRDKLDNLQTGFGRLEGRQERLEQQQESLASQQRDPVVEVRGLAARLPS